MADEFDHMDVAYEVADEEVIDYAEEPLPGFAKGYIITDLVFCLFRIFIFLLGVVGLFMVKPKDLALR